MQYTFINRYISSTITKNKNKILCKFIYVPYKKKNHIHTMYITRKMFTIKKTTYTYTHIDLKLYECHSIVTAIIQQKLCVIKDRSRHSLSSDIFFHHRHHLNFLVKTHISSNVFCHIHTAFYFPIQIEFHAHKTCLRQINLVPSKWFASWKLSNRHGNLSKSTRHNKYPDKWMSHRMLEI